MLYLFIKDSIYYTNPEQNPTKYLPLSIFLMNKFFTKSFFLFFKKLNTKNFGIMTSNLTKSVLHKTLNDLDNLISPKQHNTSTITYVPSKFGVKYLQPVTILSFAFQKKTYDTLMSYIIFLLVGNYTAPQNSFNLYYSFLIYPTNFALYPFLNLFYFKLRQF